MIDINWRIFEIKHPKATDAFESLCYFLFCRKYGLKDGIRTDFNQVGLETEPVKYSDGKYYGFQAKFFDKNINYTNILDSITKALANYEKLDHIIIFINQAAQPSCISAKKIEAKCADKGVTVEWYVPNNFKMSLNQPSNLDLAEFYFGAINVLGMLSDSKSIRMSTLLQSKEYLELSLRSNEKIITITDYCKEILDSNEKIHLFSGAAGAGKSVCMRKMLYIYGGFNEPSKNKQLEKVQALGAICIYINLNNTSLESLENIISNYKNTYYAETNNSHYIYLLDGIDEVPKNSITPTILFIESLIEKDNTKKIVISSRLSSYNKYILKASFPKIVEFSIDTLKKDQVLTYFNNKGDEVRISKLQEIATQNVNFFNHITDILTVSLLWEHINWINGQSYLTNLMKLSISAIVNDVHHRKYLESLNLPNPKEDSIVEINKRLAFFLFKNDLFNFTHAELYNVIGDIYPKCDYTALNDIVSYLADVFFDITLTNETHTFSYQHRRFSEYFTILQLEDRINDDLNYLRNNHIIINYDLFELMLIPYLQNKAFEKKDLPLAFEVGLFNVYLGNDRAWGIDKSFYLWSDWIIYSIASLKDEIFENTITDKSLPIYRYFNEVPERIISSLPLGGKKSFNDELQQNYKNYVVLIAQMHKFGKSDFLSPMLSKYQEIRELCKTNNFYYKSISNKDNYLVWRSITYIHTVILQDNVEEIINSALQNSKDINIDDLFKDYISTNVFYLSSLYYNLLIYQGNKCIEIIKRMNLNQFSILAIAATKPECLTKIIINNELVSAIKEVLEPEINNENLSGIICIALKQIFGCSLSNREEELVKNYFEITKFRSVSVFWKDHCDIIGLLIATFEKQQFNTEIESSVKRYAQAYGAFLKLINKSCSVAKFIRYIQGSIYSNTEEAYYIKVLLGKVLAISNEDELSSIKGAVNYLNAFMKHGGLLIVYHTMKLYNPDRFKRILSITELNKLNTPNVYQDIDFTSTSELLFMLSFLFSSHDDLCCYDLLLKGISNGTMRMNDRKDTIADYKLFESLEVLLKNNWISTEPLISLLKRILIIANKMNSYHIENDTHRIAMEILQKYDFDAAEFYYGQISNLEECYNFIHYNYAMAMVQRGRSIKHVVDCMDNIRASFDRYHQKVEWDSFYDKISVYLNMAVCDFYSTYEQKRAFEQACYEIDALEEAGWNRELKKEEYEIYIQLCQKYNKNIDVIREQEVLCSTTSSKKENINILDIINVIDTEDDLDEFLIKLNREYSLDSLEVNELLIKKCIDITGNIEGLINVLTKTHYPSSVFYSNNSSYFWMTIVSALKNQKSKNSILDYLLINGGGHDGFNELIKIYGFLGNRDVCVEAFEKMLSCVEFLLC